VGVNSRRNIQAGNFFQSLEFAEISKPQLKFRRQFFKNEMGKFLKKPLQKETGKIFKWINFRQFQSRAKFKAAKLFF
jgi:hypothetical protein